MFCLSQSAHPHFLHHVTKKQAIHCNSTQYNYQMSLAFKGVIIKFLPYYKHFLLVHKLMYDIEAAVIIIVTTNWFT